MAISTKESLKIKCTGTACTSTRVEKSTRENTETERGTGKGLTSGLQVKSTKANGKTTRSTDKAPISNRMATPTLEVSSKAREKAKASTYMQKETQQKVSTKTISKSVSTNTPTKTEERGRYNSPRVNSSTEEATKPAENSMIDNCLMRDCLQTLIYFSS